MTDWQRAWRHCPKTRGAAKIRRALKRHNHRLNRLVAKSLDGRHVRLNSWDVT